MKNSKRKLSVIALALVACLAVAGVSAYFTDAADVTNTFTVGEVKLELTEPNYPGNDTPDVTDITPLETIKKDPTVSNNGTNEEFVFLTVKIPYANVVTAEKNGTKNAKAWTELFTMNDLSDKWHQMSRVANEQDGYVLYTFAYGTASELTALEAGKDAEALFQSVTFANVIEGEGLENSTQNIVINAYGIQTENVNEGLTDPAGVWTVVCNQREVG